MSEVSPSAMSPRVMIIGDHLHKGCRAVVRDDLPTRFGMWRVDLDPVGACFVGPENLRPLDPSEDPYA